MVIWSRAVSILFSMSRRSDFAVESSVQIAAELALPEMPERVKRRVKIWSRRWSICSCSVMPPLYHSLARSQDFFLFFFAGRRSEYK